MRLKEAWYKKLWKFFFQSEQDRKKEVEMCNEAQRKYYGLFSSAPFTSPQKPINKKKVLRNRELRSSGVRCQENKV